METIIKSVTFQWPVGMETHSVTKEYNGENWKDFIFAAVDEAGADGCDNFHMFGWEVEYRPIGEWLKSVGFAETEKDVFICKQHCSYEVEVLDKAARLKVTNYIGDVQRKYCANLEQLRNALSNTGYKF